MPESWPLCLPPSTSPPHRTASADNGNRDGCEWPAHRDRAVHSPYRISDVELRFTLEQAKECFRVHEAAAKYQTLGEDKATREPVIN